MKLHEEWHKTINMHLNFLLVSFLMSRFLTSEWCINIPMRWNWSHHWLFAVLHWYHFIYVQYSILLLVPIVNGMFRRCCILLTSTLIALVLNESVASKLYIALFSLFNVNTTFYAFSNSRNRGLGLLQQNLWCGIKFYWRLFWMRNWNYWLAHFVICSGGGVGDI